MWLRYQLWTQIFSAKFNNVFFVPEINASKICPFSGLRICIIYHTTIGKAIFLQRSYQNSLLFDAACEIEVSEIPDAASQRNATRRAHYLKTLLVMLERRTNDTLFCYECGFPSCVRIRSRSAAFSRKSHMQVTVSLRVQGFPFAS